MMNHFREFRVASVLAAALCLAAGTFAPPWFIDHGGATPGAHPMLELSGNLKPTRSAWLQCWGLKPNAPCLVIVGTGLLNAPRNGGKLVPQPLIMVSKTSTPYGTVGAGATLPLVVPATGSFYVQVWYRDGGFWRGSNAVAMSFAVAATQP